MALPYVMPEDYGAIGKPKTCAQMGWDQAKINNKWPDAAQRFGITPSWSVDRAAWQQCMIRAHESGKVLMPGDDNYYFNGPAYYDEMFLEVIAGRCTLNSMDNSAWAFMDRFDKPTDRLDAEFKVSNTQLGISGFHLNCQPNNSGLNFNCVKYYDVKKNIVNGGRRAMGFDFCLGGEVTMNQAQGCYDGFISGLAITGDTEMSSNLIRFVLNRCHSVQNIGFGNLFAYETHYIQNMVEGNGTIEKAYYFDGRNKTTCKDLLIETKHFEQTGGANVAIIKCDLRDQKVKIRFSNPHYSGIVVDATSSGGGGIQIEGLEYAPGKAGKLFRSNNTMWRFLGNTAANANTLSGLWANDLGGVVPNKGWANDVGYNSYMVGETEWIKPVSPIEAESRTAPDPCSREAIEALHMDMGLPYVNLETGETVIPETFIPDT